MAMGSSITPVNTSFFNEDFVELEMDLATHKPVCWFHYVDDNSIVFPRGSDRPRDFLDHLSNVHQIIQFTMEKEEGKSLSLPRQRY
jgi:hypothetical protein